MNNETLLWLLVIVAIGILVMYGAFSHHPVSKIDNEPSINTTNRSVESKSTEKNNMGDMAN